MCFLYTCTVWFVHEQHFRICLLPVHPQCCGSGSCDCSLCSSAWQTSHNDCRSVRYPGAEFIIDVPGMQVVVEIIWNMWVCEAFHYSPIGLCSRLRHIIHFSEIDGYHVRACGKYFPRCQQYFWTDLCTDRHDLCFVAMRKRKSVLCVRVAWFSLGV